MIDAIISVDDNGIEERLGDLYYKAEAVMRRASNRAATHAATRIGVETEKRYIISKKTVKSAIRVYRAGVNLPFASVVVKGMHPGLEKFSVDPFSPMRRSKGGKSDPDTYTAEVIKHGGKKYLGGSPKPFVAQMPNGHMGVFRRKTDEEKRRSRRRNKRNTIVGVYGPAIPQIVKNAETMRAVDEAAYNKLLERVEHEISFELSKKKTARNGGL